MNRRLSTAALAVVLLAAGGYLLWRARAHRDPRGALPVARPLNVLPPDSAITGPVLEEHRVGSYLIRLVSDSAAGDRIVDILQGGHRVYAVREADIRLEHVGEDITGDHVPDLVLQTFSGGAHCCSVATVLSLGRTFAIVGTIDGADGDIDFEDVDGDGVLEARLGDWRFAYWREYAFAETQVPEVILRYQEGAFRPACDLMKKPAPDSTQLARQARRLTDGWDGGEPPAQYYGFAVDLIYAGNADLAFRWLDGSWPKNIPGKDAFVADLKDRLQGSPCWSPLPTSRPLS